MSSIRLINISFSYPDSPELFQGVSLHLARGWTGLVGENGGGKSTLLKLIAGQLQPDKGQVLLDPPDMTTVYCPQRVQRLTQEVQSTAESWSKNAMKWIGLLNLNPDDLSRWPTMSPGERKRWQIAAALAEDSMAILVDEPTNHLDFEAQNLLLNALSRYQGIGILVSHNRDFLDSLTTNTIRVHAGKVEQYVGSYTDARNEWTLRQSQDLGRLTQAQKETKKARRKLADKRRSRASAEKKISPKTRIKGPKDSDARSMAAKGRAQAGEAALSRQVSVLRNKVDRLENIKDGLSFEKMLGRNVFVDYEPSPKSSLLAIDLPKLRVGQKTLLQEVHLVLDRESRIHLAGPNGSGKTTLLKWIMETANLPEDKVLFLPQDMTEQEGIDLLDEVRSLPPGDRGRIMQVVAALGIDPERLLATKGCTPGEARKLKIAYGLGRRAWLLVLDEPANHLDLPSVERLEAAIKEYPGALIMVSHELRLARECTSLTWRIENRRVSIATDALAKP